jgi:NADH-ubiquinone/plastoquinone oxidoreductase, chain 3
MAHPYFLVLMLFLIFDIEVVFLYQWAKHCRHPSSLSPYGHPVNLVGQGLPASVRAGGGAGCAKSCDNPTQPLEKNSRNRNGAISRDRQEKAVHRVYEQAALYPRGPYVDLTKAFESSRLRERA